MITMAEGRLLVDVRLDRLEAVRCASDGTAPIESLALLCSGTDVRGPELETEIKGETLELLKLLSHGVCDCEGSEPPTFNCSSPTLAAGLLTRMFWLGFELGRLDSRD